MVGVDASFVAAPDGGPSFLAAGTSLVRREGRQVSLLLRGRAGGLYRQGPPQSPPPSNENQEAQNGVQMPTGLILWQPPGCCLGRRETLLWKGGVMTTCG